MKFSALTYPHHTPARVSKDVIKTFRAMHDNGWITEPKQPGEATLVREFTVVDPKNIRAVELYLQCWKIPYRKEVT